MVNPLEILWTDTCTVFARQKETDPDTRLTDFTDAVLLQDQPCKLSFEGLAAAGGDNTAAVTQSVKLFLSPDVIVPPGSRVVVTRGERTFSFCSSGIPGVFHRHQEVTLESETRWA